MTLSEMLGNLSTSEISDALDACGVEGALLGIRAIQPGLKLIGRAFTVEYKIYNDKPTDYKNAGNYIDDVPEGAVIIIDNKGRDDCTTWGNILTHVAQSKNIAGTVVFGAARDIEEIKMQQYPLFSSAHYMRSGKNRVYKSSQQTEINIQGVSIQPNDIIVGDDNGVVVIPQTLLEDVIQKANNIQQTEKNILNAISNGISLEQARQQFGYATPWIAR